MKRLFIALVTLSVGGNIFAQNTDQQVIATAGDYAESGDYAISWTLGETVISTGSGGDYILTQGFQQSKWDIVGIEEVSEISHEIRLWPNPATTHVNVEVNNREEGLIFTWTVLDMTGKQVMQGQGENGFVRVNLQSLHKSMYIIRIMDEDGKGKSYKLVKN